MSGSSVGGAHLRIPVTTAIVRGARQGEILPKDTTGRAMGGHVATTSDGAPANDAASAYGQVRARVIDLVSGVDAEEATRVVPACPEWSVHDLVAHLTCMSAALADGDLPTGDVPAWLDVVIARGRALTIPEMVAAWPDVDRLAPFLVGDALLLVDLVVHEHDLRAALGRPGDRGGAEQVVALRGALANLDGAFAAAGLGAVEVRDGGSVWRSRDDAVGWTLAVEPWEATRLLESRRTLDEVLATPGEGGGPAYAAVLDAHQPLPATSLGER
jgi:uncharacterized protein (TIGR03083 family)